MQIWIHDNKMKKITALNNDVPDMLSYTNSTWHSYLDQATSTFDFTIPKFSNGELHEDLKLINDECFVSFYVNGSYQVFYIATLQEDDFNIQLTCNNTNLEYALEYANPFNSSSAQSIQWYLEHMDLLSFAAVEIGNNEISDRKRTLTFDSQETKMNRLQSLMSNFDAEFEFKVELNKDGTYKRIVINIYQEADDTHHGIGTDRKDVVLYYSNGLKGVQVTSDKTQMFNAGVFDGKDGVNLANVEFSEKNADGVEEFYSRKGDIFVYAPLSMQRYPATMKPNGQDNWIRKDFQTEYENVNDLKAYALRTLKKYAYPLVTYTASVQSGFVSHYTDLKLGDTIRIIDKNFVGGLALEARVSEMIISFDNPANNSFVFTNYRKLDNKPSSALQTRIEQAVESKLPYRIELATTGGVTFKNNEGETIVKPSLYKGNLPYTKDVSWRWALDGVSTVGTQYSIQARDITGTEVLTVAAYVGNLEVATTEITLTNVDDGVGVESIDRYFTSSDQSDGVTIEGAEWSDKPPAPTEDGKYLWAYDEITYTDGTVTTTKPAAVGANFDVDAFRAEIAEDLKDVPNREEFENKIAEELAASKAEIATQIETAKTQAESNAKEYADTINQETAKVAELANAAADEIKADLVNVKNNLTDTSLVANNAQAAADAAKQELTNVASDLNTAKQDLTSHAQQLRTQANAQTELTKRVTTVETTANGTKTTVNELTKTVAQNGKDITSVTNRTKTVEDDLANTKTTLTQVQTTANSASQKTATLETGLDGVKADLAATTVTANTTKTNLANYQASNDKVVASLKSSLQTTDGNVSSLQTKVEAVPGQITSAVTAVEGKIPTNVGARNYIRNYGLTATGWATNNSGWKFEIIPDSTARSGQYLKATCTSASTSGGGFYKNLFDFYDGRFFGKQMTWAMDVKLSKAKSVKIGPEWGYAYLDTNATTEWKRYSKTFTVATTTEYNSWIFYTNDNVWNVGDIVYIRDVQLEDGSIATTPVPAIEDTESDITKLNTTLTQTADGLKQLSTQVTSQGNTINTHTTQISALNTGLSAKVSQSDFNTLSGRVTTAENSITAKANELSSKISSVEGKIPTNLDSLNLMTGTRDWSTKANKWHMGANWSTENEEYQGLKVHSTQNGFNGSHQNIFVKNGDVITFSFFAKATNTLSKIKVSSHWPDSSVYQAPLAGVRESDEEITITSEWKRYSKTVHITSDGSLQFRAEYNDETIPNGNTFYVAGLKLAKTSQDTGYSENLADVASDISSIAGKIPTTVGGRNYALKTGDSKSSSTAGDKLYDLSSAFDGIADDATLIIEFDWSVTAPTSTSKFRINRVIEYSDGTAEQWNDTIVTDGVYTDVSSSGGSGHYSGTFTKVPYNGKAVSSRYLYLNQTTANGTVTISNLSIRVGSLKSDWSPAPEDTIEQISSVSSEFKQTTDAIKASVSSLDKSTVKSSSLTINADGIVMKAGKSTTDVANAIGSYFAVNQNAINLFSDKINVKGNMIVNGAITSDKIASKQINTAHLNGKIITADVISSNAVTAGAIKAGAVTTDKMSANSINGDRIAAGTLDAAKIKAGSITASQIASGTITSAQIKAGAIKSINIEASAITSDKIAANSISSDKIVASGITANVIKGGTLQSLNGSTNFELDSGKLFYNSNNTGVFRVQNGASTMGLKFSNTSLTVSGTSRILSRVILGGDRRETTLDDGKWDKGGFSGLVIETIKGVEPATNEHADALRAISDTIYFTHTYSADSPTGVSAHGWKMETYAPNSSYSGNIVLKPYGINYRQSDIVVGDIRLDNGDGSGYWMRATINTLKACFGHILNGGVSSSALNAIRSELDKISGT